MQIDEQGQNYPNLIKKEGEARKELMNDCIIIIKPEDKVIGIVIQDKQDYLGECENLTDANVLKMEADLVTATNMKIRKVLDNMIRIKEIDKKTCGLPFHQTNSIRQILFTAEIP